MSTSMPRKVWTGHCLYSAGLLEAVVTVLQMEAGFIHANINLEDPIERSLNFVGDEALQKDVPVAISNSFGFGGINSCLVFSQ